MSGVVIAVSVIGVLVISGIAAGFTGMRRHAASAGRVLQMPPAEPESVFIGGALTATVSAGWPLARLELLPWGIRLDSSSRFLRFLPLSVPTWEARYEELAVTRYVTRAGSYGLRFTLTGRSDAVVFWSRRCHEILDRLEAAGAAVDRSLTSLRQAGGVAARGR